MALNPNRRRRVSFNVDLAISKNSRIVSRVMDRFARAVEDNYKTALTRKQYPPASSPGQIPAARRGLSGGLAGQLQVTRKGRTVFVRVPQYGIWLDGGTKKMAARPFIRRLLHDKKSVWRERLKKWGREERAKAR